MLEFSREILVLMFQSLDITVTKPVGLKFGLQGSTSLEHQSATFGTPDLLGEFSHAEQKMKLYETNSQDSNLCPTFSRDMGSKGILLIDGYYDCPYTKLAREAQEAGMVGVVVAEKSYACTLGKYPEWYKKQAEGRHGCKDTLPHMTGKFASDITIPAVIISRLDAERLKDCFKQVVNKANKTTDVECTAVPELEMKWNLNPHDKVSWELWTSSLLNRDVFADSYFYKMVLPRLQNISTFQPRFFVWNGTELGCRDSKKCGDACHNKNRYCHMDPDGLNTGDYSGIRMSQENMRQYCVFKTNSEQIKWWKYISLIAEKCSRAANGRRPFDVDCSKECHADAGLNFDATMKCITDNGGYGVDDDRKNSAWEEELRDRNEIDLQRLPTITVNGRIIEAELTLKIVLEAICGGFIRKKDQNFANACLDRLTTSLFVGNALTPLRHRSLHLHQGELVPAPFSWCLFFSQEGLCWHSTWFDSGIELECVKSSMKM